jgi:superfamily II DNA or RNA helicase
MILCFMRFKIVSPVKALVLDSTDEELADLREDLTYTNTAAAHDVKRHYNNNWLRRQNNEAWEKRLDFLKSKVKNTLVFEDEEGKTFIRPGSIPYLSPYDVENTVVYPIPKKIPWAKIPKFTPYIYQKESIERLLKERHGCVSITTGGGKSLILLHICRELGLKTIIMTPSAAITDQLYKEFTGYFGKGNVGKYGDGRKDTDKLFTLATGQALTRIESDSDAWKEFSKTQVFISDESHANPAETMESVCHGVLANAPYRFFFSATQVRNDGQNKLLESINGRIVHTLTTRDAILGGYICSHEFKIVRIESSNPNMTADEPLENKRIHLLRNKNIAAFAAKLANASAIQGKQTLILVEEVSQIAMIVPLLTVPYAIAHSETKKDRLLELKIPKADVGKAIEDFNKNEVKVLIGSSCISMGCNIYPVHNLVNIQGGSSEIKTKQALGRSVRLHNQNPWADRCLPKDKATIWDFDIWDVGVLDHHLKARIEWYEESGTKIEYVEIKK